MMRLFLQMVPQQIAESCANEISTLTNLNDMLREEKRLLQEEKQEEKRVSQAAVTEWRLRSASFEAANKVLAGIYTCIYTRIQLTKDVYVFAICFAMYVPGLYFAIYTHLHICVDCNTYPYP